MTSRWACFALWGPHARDVLAPLTADPLDFPYMRMRELAVGDVPVRALRVTFVGELGWELYCPTEYGAGAVAHAVGGGRAARPRGRRLPRDRLAAAGEGLPRVGRRHHARRDARTRPGSASACKHDKREFIGAEALRRARASDGADRRACAASCSRTRARSRSATSRCASAAQIVGRVTSGGYGYTVGRSIAYAYLPAELDVGTAVEVDIFGRWVAGEVAREPLFDAKGERVKGTPEPAR